MDRRKISVLLALTMIFTGSAGARYSYASDSNAIISEVLETVPVEDESYPDDDRDDAQDEEGKNDIVSETLRTTPVNEDKATENDRSDSRPEGVVQKVLKTSPVDENGNEAKGTETVDIIGSSSTPDPSELGLYAKDVVNMVMPVVPDDTYDFVMDTEDLLSRYSLYKDSYEKSSLYFTNTSGEKLHTGISDVAMAKNKSSIPVLLYVTLQVENENGWPVKYTDMDSVEADTEKNISFALVPVSVNEADSEAIDEETADFEEQGDGYLIKDDHKIYTDRMISIDETGKAEMVLYLDGTPDNFDLINDKYMAKEDAVWSSLGFAVTGACNTRADWSDVDERSDIGETLSIHISYRMDLLNEEQLEMLNDGLKPDPDTGIILFDIGKDADDDGEENVDEDNSDIKDEDVLKEEITEDKEELTDEL